MAVVKWEQLPLDVGARIFSLAHRDTQHQLFRTSRSFNKLKDQGKWHSQLLTASSLVSFVQGSSLHLPDGPLLNERLLPACRWLAQRASSTTLTEIQFEVEDCSSPLDPYGNCDACCGMIKVAIAFLRLSLACLKQANASMSLRIFFARPRLRTQARTAVPGLFEDAALLEDLKPHVIALEMPDNVMRINRAQWSGICQLQLLQVLTINEYAPWTSACVGTLTADISRMSNLRQLRICAHGHAGLETTAGLYDLVRLTRLELPLLVTGSCLQHLDGLAGLRLLKVVGVPHEPLHIPCCFLGLRSLTSLQLYFVTFAGHIQALSGLGNLQCIECFYCTFEGSESAQHFFGALASLTALVSLTYVRKDRGSPKIFASDLCSLSSLERLTLDGIRLPSVKLSACWPNLQSLDLCDNGLLELPDLDGLSSLTECAIREQDNMQVMHPLPLDALPALSRLDLLMADHHSWSAQSRIYLKEAKEKARTRKHLWLQISDSWQLLLNHL